jgi:hypothetical protein
LVEQSILTKFDVDNIGVMLNGEGKYFLNCINFDINEKMDKNSQKKLYKDEIKSIVQYFIDKKTNKPVDRKANGEGLFSTSTAHKNKQVVTTNASNTNSNMSKIM